MGHVTWPHPFQGQFAICRLRLLMFNHISSLKCLRLPVTNKWKATLNVKILVLSHPLGDVGVTHGVHLRLDGKHIVDFLLAIIELFSLALMAAALLCEICRNRRFLKGGSLWAHIFGRWGRRQQSVYGLLDRGKMIFFATTLPLEVFTQRNFVADFFSTEVELCWKK